MSPRILNPYGYYDISKQEYVITRPDTPTPWINYLGQGKYGGIISNTAGGYSFDRDPRNRRITRYRYNAIPVDQPGRYLYLRDEENGEYWSPTWQPIPQRALEKYECRHGAGYTRIRSQYKGIDASVLYFIPLQSDCEVWVLHLRNTSRVARVIRTFSYVEFSYYDAMTDITNLDWGGHIFHSAYTDGTIISGTQFSPTKTFFSSNIAPAGFDTDREVFVGRGRDLSWPIVVEEGKTRQSEAPRGNNIGCLSHEFKVEPGGEIDLIFILGLTNEPVRIPEFLLKYQSLEDVSSAFSDLYLDWDAFLKKMTVETPDIEMNAMLNFWNQVQCRTTIYWSRFVSAYETGLGRGMGTRDSAQDTLAIIHSEPDLVRQTLNRLWHLQFRDGHTWHQVFPLTNEGGPGLAAEFPTWPQWFSDDHLWLVLAVCTYLNETGDYQYLSEKIDYWDGEDPYNTVWDHMLRAFQFTLDHRGPNGLPRIGFSDWDDTLNLDHGSGKAESVWTGQFFCRVALDFVELCDYLGKKEHARAFLNLHQEIANIIQDNCWDGEWYLRAFDDEGLPVGTHTAIKQKISLNTQTWSVIGEIGQPDRQKLAMQKADEFLNTPYGLALMSPPYDSYSERVQGISTYPPGAKENGGIFSHANTWAIIAASILSQPEKAVQYYRQLNPLTRTDADRYNVEPYVYCANICGPDHPQFGLGRNAWLSGTAAWMYVAATQYILGIHPTHQGLKISPMVPESWQSYSVERWRRNKLFKINVIRVGPGHQVRIMVNDRMLGGNIIPDDPAYSEVVEVKVFLGE
jgi:cellobiose phosphorylase